MSWTYGKVNGMTWGWTGARGTWATAEAGRSMAEMAKLGINWVTLAFAAYQDHPQATEIRYQEAPTVTDDELRGAIAKARELGLRVCLKPIVNCGNGVWRAHIGFFDQDVPGEPSWTEWFASYERFIGHYARIAEEEQVELFAVGCEMVQMDRREAQIRAMIAKVRSLYSGLITYNCDKYQEDRIAWWDAVDVISSSGYYPTGTWAAHLARIKAVVETYGKPFLFLEGGCPSRQGASLRPNDWNLVGAADEEEQARYYEETFAHCLNELWVLGFMFWDWPARLYDAADAAANDDYCIYGKKAAEVVSRYYKGNVFIG